MGYLCPKIIWSPTFKEENQTMGIDDFESPGPGFWQLDRSHFPGGATPIAQELVGPAIEEVYRREWAKNGIPAETLSVRFVNGFWYSRMRPLILADRPSHTSPPFALIWLVSRLHPEFRRREKAAKNFIENSQEKSSEVIAHWHQEGRPALVAKNLDFQEVNLPDLSDADLARHLHDLILYLRETLDEHFRLHIYDLGPIGRLLVSGSEWGIPSHQLVSLLAGASPSTTKPLRALKEIAEDIEGSGISPSSLEEISSISPEISEKLDAYLRYHGAVLYAGYDIDSPTLLESPEVILATIKASANKEFIDSHKLESHTTKVLENIPDDYRDQFQDLLFQAREAMDLRDDNGPITSEWPLGLLRLGMLEVARRLKKSGQISEMAHVFELTTQELPEMLATTMGPTKEELSERAKLRAEQKKLNPPTTLGKEEIPPPVEALPEHLAQAVTVIQAILTELGLSGHQIEENDREQGLGKELVGVGIGTASYSRIARVAEDAHEALTRLQPGEVLVTRTTSPAYNMVLTLAGGLITEEGGPMCHAAVLSRELNLPAVIGVTGALKTIKDGTLVEVDPENNRVRILDQ